MIGFAGLSHLGIIYSVASASKGHVVAGYDGNSALCAALQKGELPVYEPGLEDLLTANKGSINFTDNIQVIAECGLIFLSIDIPTENDGESDLTPLNSLAEKVISSAKPGTTIVVLSQVPPGYTRKLAGSLESQSTQKDISLFYQVETLVFGSAVQRALEPERIIVGAPESDRVFPETYNHWLTSFDCPVLPMAYESAELTKLAINVMLTSSVSATNTLAELCQAIGADWHEIIPALRLDRRIGPYAYLSPGLGLSGGNLERDLATIIELSKDSGTDNAVIESYLSNSRHCRDWVLKTLHAHSHKLGSDPVVAVWGLAYKPDTDSVKNSPAMDLIANLTAFTVQAYDPQAHLNGAGPANTREVGDPLDACDGAQVLVAMTPWKQFSQVDLNQVKKRMAGQVIIDPLGILDQSACLDAGFTYARLGRPIQFPKASV